MTKLKTLIEKITDKGELAEAARAVFAHPDFDWSLVDLQAEAEESPRLDFTPTELYAERDKSKKRKLR